ncbi:hypothetical protein C8F01DRAFT_1295479 [Mycena amicta]|nr:hypothetical protein C8F01DRAFT_1295479 [Mycena amicta]
MSQESVAKLDQTKLTVLPALTCNQQILRSVPLPLSSDDPTAAVGMIDATRRPPMPSKLDYRIRPYLLFDMPQIRVPLANGFVTSNTESWLEDSVADVVPASSDTGPFCSSLPRQVVARCSSHSASEYHSLKPRLGVCVIETAFVFTIRSAIRHFLWRFCDQAQTTSGIAIRVKARGSGSARNGSVKAGDESEVYEDDEDVLGYVGLGYQPTSSLSSLYPTLRDPHIHRRGSAHGRRQGSPQTRDTALTHILHPRLQYDASLAFRTFSLQRRRRRSALDSSQSGGRCWWWGRDWSIAGLRVRGPVIGGVRVGGLATQIVASMHIERTLLDVASLLQAEAASHNGTVQ